MTTADQRIAALERQVADLAARLEEDARQAATLKAAFDAGRASVLEDPARRTGVACRPRHLQVVSGGAS